MFQDAAAPDYIAQGGRKAAAIVAWTIVFAAPTSIVHSGQGAPSLARRVRYDGQIAIVQTRIAFYRPTINIGQIGVAARGLYKKSGDFHVVVYSAV